MTRSTTSTPLRTTSTGGNWPRTASLHTRRNWAQEELDAVRAIGAVAAALLAADLAPEVPRAATIPAERPFWRDYPGFLAPFEAGQMRVDPEAWAATFAEAGVTRPMRIQRWTTEGYLVWVDKGAMRSSLARHNLSAAEEAWALAHTVEVLLPVGAVERVPADEHLPSGAAWCDVVAAYRAAYRADHEPITIRLHDSSDFKPTDPSSPPLALARPNRAHCLTDQPRLPRRPRR